MSFVRPGELAACRSAIAQGLSVEVVGRPGSGRSTLLRTAATELEESGVQIVSIAGLPSAQDRPLRALELSPVDVPADRDPGARAAAAAAAIVEAVSKRSSVIVVDDVDLLDDDSWSVLAAVRTAVAVPIIASRRPHPDADHTRSLRTLTSSSLVLRLRPLTFEATTELLLSRLDGDASLDLLSRVHRESGGIPSLVTAIVDAATVAGRLTRSEGTWEIAGDLWHDSLSGAVEHLLVDLSPAQRDTVEALGMLGAADLDTAESLAGAAQLEELEETEIVTVVATGTKPSVVLAPPLLHEWVQQSPPSIRRRRVLAALGERLPAASPTGAAAVGPLSTASSAVSSVVMQRRDGMRAQAREAWERHPDFGTALTYLDELMADPDDPATIELLLARCAEEDGAPPARAQYRRFRMDWLAYREGRPDEAVALADGLPRELLPYSEYLGAAALRIVIDAEGVPADIDERLAAMREPGQAEAGWAEVTEAYTLVVRGRSRSALAVLDTVQPAAGSELEGIADLLRLWAQASFGDLPSAFDEALRRTFAAVAALDLRMAREFALAAAACVVSIGDYNVGSSLLGSVLTLGAPGVGQERTQAGLLGYAAIFTAVSGHLAVAEAFTREAERLDVAPGPLAGSGAKVGRATLFNLTGDRAAAAATMADAFRGLADNGYILLAADTGLIGSAMFGMGELLTGIGPLIRTIEGDWRQRHLAHVAALAAQDADAIEAGVDGLIGDGRLAAAQYAVTELSRLRSAAQDAAGVARAARLLGRVTGLRDEIDVAASRWLYSTQYQVLADLSAREHELAVLAVKGYNNAEIAERLSISLRTVETHLSRVYQKLGVRNRAGLLDLPWNWD